ncbi:cation transporter [candidate division WOR-1 bacterium RIFOXYA12_FULL_43_27]|uniref:Cation transporter n=1 Tax=candidate division WOR-1 bacterium RIFOXYC2_FULL_46_14 TaxID=1802587 RepID=A0A1F4U6L3_UNCSA|nr:MAG: cation transporter [candidate division WOR-1 bacterium RIFOXYA12_FULL_43_27]OGC19496.1 MAG: cation transporter [candidate division WOR-1 bacterium RIFOXYB2_FULL_46_45]OGC30484.1 MAG: cation transporter [candidate division WOR-1 bacterium RIFOXYA2_FULL_46_56]OGC40552.1 MAG: cation transporter [candidate division WOR-1 bacterium RIFOXYC2_FULL_46_14]
MINKVIELVLKRRIVSIIFFAFLILWGIYAAQNTPIDAIPDIGEKQVIVYADWMGRSPKDVEDQVTYPLTNALQGVPGVKVIRSSSAFGFSMIYMIFNDNVDYYFARSRVLERLNVVQKDMPNGVIPALGPDATGLGQIFWYTVEGGGKNLAELRSIQDWYVRYQLNSVPGVAEVASVGGFIKEYQIDIDPNRLLSYNIPASHLFMAVKKANLDVGAKVIEDGSREFIVRGLGFIKSVKDVENISVGEAGGTPIYIKDLGNVSLGPAFRRGALDKEGKEAVGGVVVMRYGQNPLKVIEGVKQKIKEIEPGLPSGVKIKPFYDRTGLINRTIATLTSALWLEVLITVVVIYIFLLSLPATLIVSVILPLGVLVSFIGMYYLGIDANVMSLGGLAIAIGAMVDYGIIVTENIFRHLAERGEKVSVVETTLAAVKEISAPLLTATMTTVIGFIPVFVLQGEEGRLFRPLAYTKTFAMAGAVLLSLTLVPVLATFFLKGKLKSPEENPLAHKLGSIYRPMLSWSLNHKKIIIYSMLAVLLLGFGAANLIGREFMPPLDEGSILFMPVMSPAVSLTEAFRVMRKQDEIIKSFPEVEQVVGKLGRAETSTDPAPVEMFETVINLKPKSKWRPGMTKDKLVMDLDQALQIPGVSNIWTQPIVNRIAMLSTGIRTNVGVKIFGPDLNVLGRIAQEVEKEVKGVRGAVDIYSEKVAGKPYIEIKINREAIARYGIAVSDVQAVIEMALGGAPLTWTVEGRERYPVRVRYYRELRNNLPDLKRVLVKNIPLAQLAEIETTIGPSMINSENGLLRAFVLMNVRGRDMVGFVEEARKVVAQKVKLPSGYFIQWSGEFENQVRARQQLLLVVPMAFFIILMILYISLNSLKQLGIIILGIPVSIAGGLMLQFVLGFNFSVAVWVGYIALAGIATDGGIIMISVLNDLFGRKEAGNSVEVKELVIEGAALRVRPVMMTVATTILALIPLMFSSGAGSEIMKPMATPLIGGLVSATFLNLFVVPVLYARMKEGGK